MTDMYDLINNVTERNKLYSFEGERGVRNLTTIVGELNSQYSSINAFLEDNPGAIEAIVEWIQKTEVTEWKENLIRHGYDNEDDDEEDDE